MRIIGRAVDNGYILEASRQEMSILSGAELYGEWVIGKTFKLEKTWKRLRDLLAAKEKLKELADRFGELKSICESVDTDIPVTKELDPPQRMVDVEVEVGGL